MTDNHLSMSFLNLDAPSPRESCLGTGGKKKWGVPEMGVPLNHPVGFSIIKQNPPYILDEVYKPIHITGGAPACTLLRDIT